MKQTDRTPAPAPADIAPTATATAIPTATASPTAIPTAPPTSASLARRLLAPRSVAVIGASDSARRIGGRPIAAMLARGYRGAILPVNPKRETVQGLPAFATIADLPEPPEVAIIAIAAAEVGPALDQLGRLGTGAAIVFSAGFAEVGPAGAALEADVVAIARRHGIRLLGPNSLGLLVPGTGFYGSFTSTVESGYPAVGRVAIASQSGAYGGHLLWLAREHDIGLSACVMTGNEADVTLGDVLAMLVDDPDTDVIAVYSEGIRDGDRFIAAIEAARRARKPVVMMKVGTSALGSAAALSHTASLAGNDRVTDAVLAEFGVCRARSTEHLLDVARLATRRIYPVGNTLGVVTISGGAGVIVADAAEVEGLPMPPMPAAAQQALRDLIPFSSARNPVDCTAQVLNQPALIGRFIEETVSAGGYRAVIVFFTYAGGGPSIGPVIRAELAAIRERHPDRLLVACILASPDQARLWEDAGLPVFADPARAVAAIAAMGRFGDAFARAPSISGVPITAPEAPGPASPATGTSASDGHPSGTLPSDVLPSDVLPSDVRPSGTLRSDGRLSEPLPIGPLNEADALALLAAAGIETAGQRVCTDAEAAVAAARCFGYPVVLKIASADIAHKSDIGGVLLDVADDAAVSAGFATLIERATTARPDARLDGVLVARQLPVGVECLAGVQRDPVFGPVAVVGLGGIFVELLGDVAVHRCPFDAATARAMIASLRGAAILDGARGRPAADVDALARLLARLSVFAASAGPRLRSIDLNPVIVLAAGDGAIAVDAVIEVDPAVAAPPADAPAAARP